MLTKIKRCGWWGPALCIFVFCTGWNTGQEAQTTVPTTQTTAVATAETSAMTEAQQALLEAGPAGLYRDGVANFTAGNFTTAIGYFKTLLEVFGAEPDFQKDLEGVYYALGCSYYNVGQYGDAVSTLNTYAQRYPSAKFLDEAAFRTAASYQAQEMYGEAIVQYRKVVAKYPGSPFAEDAAYQVAVCYIIQEQNAEAIPALEEFVTAFPDSDLCPLAMVFLARGYFQAENLTKALETLEAIKDNARQLDHVVYANFLAIEIGDAAFENTDYDLALRAYRRVRTKESLMRLQKKLIGRAEMMLAYMEDQKVDPTQLAERFREERRLRASLETTKDSFNKLLNAPDYDSGLFHRIGRCFYSVDRYWEARVAFTRVVAEATDKTIQEAGHFDLILCLNRLRQFPELIEEANRYLAKYGKDQKFIENKRVPSVAFMRAEAYVNQELFEEAEKEMAELLDKYPQHVQRPRIEFYLALSIAMQERFEESIKLFRAWMQKHPNDSAVPEVEYWLPVAMFYNGQYKDALPLFNEYYAKYGMSIYAPEAEYRAALCKYSLEDFEGAARDLGAWLAKNPEHTFKWEALITQGDAFAAVGLLNEAKEAYLNVTTEAGPFYYLAIMQLAKVYKALDTKQDYLEMADVFEQYIKDNPDSPNVIEAAYQAGWALRQAERLADARRLYWATIEKYGNNRAWEGCGPLINDLKGLYNAEPEGFFKEQFEKAISKAREGGRMTLLSRLILAETRWKKGDMLVEAESYSKRFLADVLDAESLAFLGDAFIKAGEPARGMPYLGRLMKDFPTSKYLDLAYTRQAEAALQKNENQKALDLALIATEKAYDPTVLMEANFVLARAYQALGKFTEAIEAYNVVLANRITPKPLKPESMLGIAACLEEKGDYKKAIPYYQRVYVMYQAYTNALATAYLRSGQAFEKINDRQAAINTYKEMLTVESLAEKPETKKAKERLLKLES